MGFCSNSTLNEQYFSFYAPSNYNYIAAEYDDHFVASEQAHS